MSHTITGHTILNGSRNLVVQFNIQSDGVSGQYADFNLLDISDYTGGDSPARRANAFDVKKISGSTSVGAGIELKFGDTGGDHKTFFLSPINTTQGWDFHEEWVGGLSPLLANSDGTIRITSLGLDASGDWITVVLWLKKKYKIQGG